MDLYKIIGYTIRNIRLQKDLSQIKVSSTSGTNHSYYCEIERGCANPSIKKLYAILLALGVSPLEFIEAVSSVVHGIDPEPDTESTSK